MNSTTLYDDMTRFTSEEDLQHFAQRMVAQGWKVYHLNII